MLLLKSLTALGILCIQKTTDFCRGWICNVCINVTAWAGLLEPAIIITPSQGLLTKPSTYTAFEKKNISFTETVYSPDICSVLSPSTSPWFRESVTTNRAGEPLKNSRISDSSTFPVPAPFSNHNQHIGEILPWSVTVLALTKTTEHSLLTMQPWGFNRYLSRRSFYREKKWMPCRLPPGFIFPEVGKLVGKTSAFIRKGQ